MNLLWYARRLGRMAPAEIKGRILDARIKRRWRARQVRSAAADPLPLPASVPAFASAIDPAAAAALPEEVGRGCCAPRMARSPGGFISSTASAMTSHAIPTGSSTRGRAGARRIPPTRSTSTVATSGRLARSSTSGSRRGTTSSRSSPPPSFSRRTRGMPSSRQRSCAPGGGGTPSCRGVHWTSGIELGVRLLSWVWVRRLLAGWPDVATLFEQNPDFVRQLHHHQEYLARLRSHGSSANNHIIAEAAGQFAACCAFPYFAETAGWREDAAAVLRREARLQTFESGLNRELASSYHVFVLELLLAAAVEGEAAGYPLGADVWQRICAMIDALAATLDVRGRPPRQGDGDHGRGLLLDHPEADPCASLLATGAALFGARDVVAESGADRSADTALARAGRRPEAGRMPAGERCRTGSRTPAWSCCGTRRTPRTRSGAAAITGRMAICRSRRMRTRTRSRSSCGAAGWKYWSIRAPTPIRASRNGARISARPSAHNCLELAGQSQSVAGGPFMWLTAAAASEVETSGLDGGSRAVWRATTRRLSAAVARRRARTHGHPPSRHPSPRGGGCRGQRRPP